MEIRIDPDLQGKLVQLEARLEALRQEHRIPGLSVAVVIDQEVVYLKGLGSAPDGGSATPDTVYPVPSLIRPFGHPWTVRELARLDVVLARGGVPELQPYLAWHGEDAAGTRLQVAWESGKGGSVLCLKSREKKIALILVAGGEVEKSLFVDAFAKTFL